jgi:hypothetical protein
MIYEPADKRVSILLRRNRFFDALENLVPEVRASLLVTPLEWLVISAEDPTFEKQLDRFVYSGCEGPEPLKGKQSERFFNEVSLWQRSWNLPDRWVKAVALKTLLHVYRHPELSESIGWMKSGVNFPVPSNSRNSRLSFNITPWDPTGFLTLEEHERSEMKKLRELLAEQASSTIAVLESAGWIQVKRPPKDAHYEWLVAFQVRSASTISIAKGFFPRGSIKSARLSGKLEKADDRIKKAIRKLASTIELTLRTKIT